MLRARIIPCLLVHNGGLVKTTRFGGSKYIGDPLNAVRIFNEKQVDELIVVDIDATTKDLEPNYGLIANLAAECRMPLCYGGGVRTVEQIERIVSLGVEKVSLGSAAAYNPGLIKLASQRVGSQSIVAVMDVKKSSFRGRYEVLTHNGSKKTGCNPVEMARQLQALGAGEILLNSIDRDGTMKGYDLGLIDAVRKVTRLPMTVIGGAGSFDDMRALVIRYGVIGAAAGSLFVFKGKYRAVLIQYPQPSEIDLLSAVL
ncbi:histidine biosynthesis family protein [Synechococcus sp. BIOS-U3-1]|uniref:AglZ/HisF2 family acetamidino modification protein n=1 Tax=Synechococcus sp. BIOS-U3-1 TaxID=1400865 RepID=UPI001648344D|nr:AglZ/HisF2 family acetamidino modification protein [Synechococcus sp. BIOS-U3-1]QNI57186.1 histidine biosynthesis family protein [Synechococcus sp. BIOS-U3-1]